MSATRSNSKRKRQEEENEESSSAGSTPKDTLFREWLDEGTPQTDGSIDHEAFTISIGDDIIEIGLGDAVLMRSPDESEYTDDSVHLYGSSPSKASNNVLIARIERIWEQRKSRRSAHSSGQESPYNFRARWFLKRPDIEALRGEFSGPVSEDFESKLTEHDLVLSNQTDENPITSICGDAQVVYRHPDADRSLPVMPASRYVCRYSMAFGANNDAEGTVEVMPFTGENDDWNDFLTTPNLSTAKKYRSGTKDLEECRRPSPRRSNSIDELRSKQTTSSTPSSDSDSVSSIDKYRQGGMDEGTTEQRDIRVGPEHQVPVPRFVPNQKVVSRNPTLVWKSGKVSQDDMHLFLKQAAAILIPYLREHRLTHEEPYSPLPWDQIEAMVRATGRTSLPTLSSVCTVSSLSKQRTGMLRECDADALLKALHDKGYDTKTTLDAIKASPGDFLTVWSMEEKELFNSGFRRYSGSLRMIYKGIAPSKDFRDVIDYHYRFKIPDQFRRFQDTKREQAVRMMECIETRRNINAAIGIAIERKVASESSSKRKTKDNEWLKTGIMDATGAIEERRVTAKELLVDVEEKLGKETMADVVDAIKKFHQNSVADLKASLFDILKDNPEFHKRFIEFLPKRFRA